MKKVANKNKSGRSKFLFLGLGAGVIALSGIGYWYFFGRKGVVASEGEEDILKQLSEEKDNPKPKKPKIETPKPNNAAPTKATSITPPATWVLKKGSKGVEVKQLQEALVKKYGKSILPKYGVDGDFDLELENALRSKGFPVVLDYSTYTKIVSPEKKESTSPKGLDADSKQAIDIAKNIWLHCTTKKFTSLLDALKRIKDTPHYVKVNELFKTIRLDGVRQTIVNAAFNSFSDETSKQFIRNEFIRIGLKYNGEKWSLSGLEGRKIQTTQKTSLINEKGSSITVPADTLLGFVKRVGRYNTKFRTLNNQILYVPTKHIRYV